MKTKIHHCLESKDSPFTIENREGVWYLYDKESGLREDTSIIFCPCCDQRLEY